MLIQVKSKQEGMYSATNTLLGRQVVYIDVDGVRVGLITGDDLNAQLIAQGFEIVEIKR